MSDVVAAALCLPLSDAAERVRWHMTDVRWHAIDRDKVTPQLTELAKAIAYAELTTTSATRRFLTELADDVDFTQWISVWFYEETRHPQVLLRWLHEVGVAVDEQFVQRGRATAPFMRSRMGTLVTNIVSEMVASAGYVAMAGRVGEPILAGLLRNLAADEARHGASFYAYAKRHLERARDPGEREAHVRDALKVLYVWFEDNANTRHPVNEFYARGDGLPFEEVVPRDRIIALIGTLLDLPLATMTDVLGAMKGARHEQA